MGSVHPCGSGFESIAPKTGCVPQTLLTWAKCTEIDAAPGLAWSQSRRGASRSRGARTKSCGAPMKTLKTASAFLPK